MSVTNKAVLVTGAARGIGRAIAQRLAQRGGRVAIHCNQDRSVAEETLASLAGRPHQTFPRKVPRLSPFCLPVRPTLPLAGSLLWTGGRIC